ncbi:MAG: RodZ domain-containing protein [Spirochaetota bacterium]
MESIGEKLKSIRESKKITLKEVAAETNIASIYIEALEDEDFDKFPGETYVIGFLKSYSEYLKIDPDEIITMYKAYKIGESATPLEELTRPTKSSMSLFFSNFFDTYKNLVFYAGVALVSLFVVWGIWSLTRSDVKLYDSDSLARIKQEYEEKQNSRISNIHNLQLSNEKGFTLLYSGEAVLFLVENKEVVFLLKEVSRESVAVSFMDDSDEITLELDEDTPVSVEGSPRELILTLKGLTENRAKIMVSLGKKMDVEESVVLENDDIKPLDGDNTQVIAQSNKSLKIVFDVRFVQKSFLEIYLDGSLKQRGFMPAGSYQRWEASEYIQVKIGNAGGINAKINGKEFSFGQTGQVANKVITWKKDVQNPNLYHIDVKDW